MSGHKSAFTPRMKMSKEGLSKHNKICRLYETGSSIKEIAKETGYKESTVKQLLCRYGVYEFKKASNKLDEMINMRKAGKTLKEIAEATGFHYSTVSVELVKHGKGKGITFGEPEIDESKLTYAKPRKEPERAGQRGRSSDAPCMIVFCAFEQIQTVIKYAEKYGFKKNIPLVFCKNYSPQVLKANMRIVGATEYALVLYREKLPKFRNIGADGKNHMVFNWFQWNRDNQKTYPKIHPAQKPVNVLKKLIEVFTDEGDTVIDPCAGSATTGRACMELNRNFYGFEISKDFYKRAVEEMLVLPDDGQLSLSDFPEVMP